MFVSVLIRPASATVFMDAGLGSCRLKYNVYGYINAVC